MIIIKRRRWWWWMVAMHCGQVCGNIEIIVAQTDETFAEHLLAAATLLQRCPTTRPSANSDDGKVMTMIATMPGFTTSDIVFISHQCHVVPHSFPYLVRPSLAVLLDFLSSSYYVRLSPCLPVISTTTNFSSIVCHYRCLNETIVLPVWCRHNNKDANDCSKLRSDLMHTNVAGGLHDASRSIHVKIRRIVAEVNSCIGVFLLNWTTTKWAESEAMGAQHAKWLCIWSAREGTRLKVFHSCCIFHSWIKRNLIFRQLKSRSCIPIL